MEKKRSVGVTVFVILLIAGCFHNMSAYTDIDLMKFMLQPLPEKIIAINLFI